MTWRPRRTVGEQVQDVEQGLKRAAEAIARLLAIPPLQRTPAQRHEAAQLSRRCPTCAAQPFRPCTRTTGLRGAAPETHKRR